MIRFISDLHLSINRPDLTKLFIAYLAKIQGSTEALYILGDLFEFWIGDDVIADFEKTIAKHIAELAKSGVKVYFLAGNRDFLLGKRFAKLANMRLLKDPHVIRLGHDRVLLTHGDDLCSLDVAHQRFRRLSRNALIKKLFLTLPKCIRLSIAAKIRESSKKNQKNAIITDVVARDCLAKMQAFDCTVLIHGHTHRPQIKLHHKEQSVKRQIVLSDWQDAATELCYNSTHKYQFNMRV